MKTLRFSNPQWLFIYSFQIYFSDTVISPVRFLLSPPLSCWQTLTLICFFVWVDFQVLRLVREPNGRHLFCNVELTYGVCASPSSTSSQIRSCLQENIFARKYGYFICFNKKDNWLSRKYAKVIEIWIFPGKRLPFDYWVKATQLRRKQ